MITFTINGFFTQQQAEAIVRDLNGKTYYHFDVSYSNCCGNCTIIVSTDYDSTEEEAKDMFIHYAFAQLARFADN